jgi:BlaR1 peptidase M56/SecD-like export protein
MNALAAYFQATLLQADWAERIGWTLFHSVWQIAQVAALYAIVSVLLRNRSAAARYAFGCVALLAMVAFPVGTYLLMPDDAGLGATDRSVGVKSMAETPALPGAAVALRHAAGWPHPSGVEGALPPVEVGTPASIAAAIWLGLRPWMPWVTAAWFAGVMLLSLRPIWGWLHVRRLQRHGVIYLSDALRQAAASLAGRLGVKRTVQFVQSTLIEVPTVVGYLRPIVLLPTAAITGLSVAEIELVLAHELAHVRRHDYLINLGQTIIEALLFFHPGMWWVSSQVRKERENCCDDIAVALSGDRSEYARALTRLEQQRVATPVAVLAATGGSLLDRVRRLMGRPAAEFGYRIATAWLAGLMTIGLASLVLAIGGSSQGDRQEPAEAEVETVVNSQSEPGAGDDNTPASDRDAMLDFARALAAGDFDRLKQTWEFQDDLNRQFAEKMAAALAGHRETTVTLVSMQPLSKETLFACFLVENGPKQFLGPKAVPLPLTFQRQEGRWRCPPPGNLRAMVSAQAMTPDRIGRRAITQNMIAVRFGSGTMRDWTARMKAQRDAFAKLAGPPYNLSQFKQVAEQMQNGIEKQETILSSMQAWEDVWRLALQEGGKEMLPRADDFHLSLYLEANKDDPNARILPFAAKDTPFPLEPFPCLTEDAVLKSKVIMDPTRHVPAIDVKLTQDGAKNFAQLTGESVGRRLAIVVDGKVVSAPMIRSRISGGNARIDGNFSRQEAEAIVAKLNSYRKSAQEFLERLDRDIQGVKKPNSTSKKAVPLNSWSPPVMGVRARLTGVKHVMGRSDWPHPVLRLRYDAKNEGQHILHLPENGLRHQVEVDGQWYMWVDPRLMRHIAPAIDGDFSQLPVVLSEKRDDQPVHAIVGPSSAMLDFGLGRLQQGQEVEIAGNWWSIPQGKESEYAKKRYSGYIVGPEKGDYGEELMLTPGRHQIRVAVVCPSARAPFHGVVRTESQPLWVEIDALSSKVIEIRE